MTDHSHHPDILSAGHRGKSYPRPVFVCKLFPGCTYSQGQGFGSLPGGSPSAGGVSSPFPVRGSFFSGFFVVPALFGTFLAGALQGTLGQMYGFAKTRSGIGLGHIRAGQGTCFEKLLRVCARARYIICNLSFSNFTRGYFINLCALTCPKFENRALTALFNVP